MNEPLPKCKVYYQSEVMYSFEFIQRSAVKIQKHVRGFLLRLKNPLKQLQLQKYSHKHYHDSFSPDIVSSDIISRLSVISKAQKASTKLATAINDQNDAVDAVLLSIDKELDWARNVMRSVEIKTQPIDWKSIKKQFLQKRESSCPICLSTFTDYSKIQITSCGHCFHDTCLREWIEQCFSSNFPMTCPECRSAFQYQYIFETHDDSFCS